MKALFVGAQQLTAAVVVGKPGFCVCEAESSTDMASTLELIDVHAVIWF